MVTHVLKHGGNGEYKILWKLQIWLHFSHLKTKNNSHLFSVVYVMQYLSKILNNYLSLWVVKSKVFNFVVATLLYNYLSIHVSVFFSFVFGCFSTLFVLFNYLSVHVSVFVFLFVFVFGCFSTLFVLFNYLSIHVSVFFLVVSLLYLCYSIICLSTLKSGGSKRNLTGTFVECYC